jgi:hypothetical protein
MSRRSWAELATGAMAIILLGAGALGFVVPDELSPTSGAPAYNVFHLAAGAVAAACFLLRSERAGRAFALVFGAVDLYQALAQALGLWPQPAFRWKTADLVLHVLIGGALVAVALVRRAPAEAPLSPRS